MGQIKFHEFATLDGVIAAPTWTFDYEFSDQLARSIGGLTDDAGAPKRSLKLAECDAFDNGVVHLAYTTAS